MLGIDDEEERRTLYRQIVALESERKAYWAEQRKDG